ncbi:MAG: DNA cytosine methyltransferase, partial [Oscillospiraceae bacterium]|nr:DNA cytosine methyltransferase [Oscillospiraceae bacterium]
TDDRGQLFYRIIDILKQHEECKFVILENVRNLADNKENWQIVCDELKELGFVITEEPIIESPHHFGVPQIRDRVYILGVKKQYIDGRRKMPDGYIT